MYRKVLGVDEVVAPNIVIKIPQKVKILNWYAVDVFCFKSLKPQKFT